MSESSSEQATRIAFDANDAADNGDWDRAESLYREALSAFEAIEDWYQAAICRVNLAQIVHRPDDPTEGCSLLQESLAEFEASGHTNEAEQVKALIAELCDQEVQSLSSEVLASIHNNTVAFLTIASDEHEAFRDSILEAADRAKQLGDANASAYLAGIARLLNEGITMLDDITPSIPEIYQPAWNTLSAHLMGHPVPPTRGLPNEVLNVIINDAAAALTHQPEARDVVLGDVSAAAQSAKQMGRTEESAFLTAITRLLAEGPSVLDDIQQEVPLTYRDAWKLLADHLQKSGRD